MEEEKKEAEHSHKKINITNKVRENPWMLATFACGVLILILLFSLFFGGFTGHTISKDKIGELAITFLNNNLLNSPGELISVKEVSGLYQINVNINNQSVPLYFTKDGKWIEQGGANLPSIIASSKVNTQTEVPKSDKPLVELFVWAYCPFGVKAQAPFVEVMSLLKDKIDFKVWLYHDGHGAHETQQNKIQACIQKIAKDKYWDYVNGFVNNIYSKCGSSGDINCDKTESVNLMKSLGIDDVTVMTCVSSEGDSLFNQAIARAKEKGVTGSPTLLINGIKSNEVYQYNAEVYKGTICNSFNDLPSECNTKLSTSSASSSSSASC
jgi:hypothetical protein